jgi:hypothetical protein
MTLSGSSQTILRAVHRTMGNDGSRRGLGSRSRCGSWLSRRNLGQGNEFLRDLETATCTGPTAEL